jgi:MFS family permease
MSFIPAVSTKPSLRDLNGYQWFVFAMASLAWLFDCLDQQLFILARNDALKSLLPGADPTTVKLYGGYATSIFLAGWATGGLFFGSIGDRVGRAKTLTITVLIYSLCTGLSAFSTGWLDFAAYRFLTGLGVGGVFGLAVALIADSLPPANRPGALGLLQALSAVGNVTAGLISMLMASLTASGTIAPGTSWKYMFLIGAVPAFLCVFIQMRLKEPANWIAAKAAAKETGVRFGSYLELFGDSRWRTNALLGMLLCITGVVGLWGIGFFSPELVGDVITKSLREKGIPEDQIASQKGYWIGINSIIQNLGAFFGMIGFSWVAQKIGRKGAFTIGFIAAFFVTFGYFRMFQTMNDLWMSALMGFFQLGLFAGFAIYLPELFPLRLRSTGTSFCYNLGRFIAASGPFTLGMLQQYLAQGARERGAPELDAFRDACCAMSTVFLLGLVAVYFLPETKGKPLPE